MRLTLPSGTPCELALPSSGQVHSLGRGVVIAPDIFGMRALFDDLSVQLAETYGWTVVVVEPFPGRELLSLDERFEAMSSLDDAVFLEDLKAGAELARRNGSRRVAIIGFCMGGMYALKASELDCFDKVVSFYGMIRVPQTWQGEGQRQPLDALRRRNSSEVLAIIGGKDQWTPEEDVDDLEATGALVVRYPEADHGFVHDPSRPAHRPADAADAWRRAAELISD